MKLTAGDSPGRTDTIAIGESELLAIEGLKTHFTTDEGVVRAVDGVSLAVARGRTMCVVGESGCGKSVTARSVLGLVEPPGKVEAGHVWWRPDRTKEPIDLAALDPRGETIRTVRGGQIGMVFQEPMASMSPMYTIGAQLTRAIRLHQDLSRDDAYELALTQLARVGIPQPAKRFDAYPFQLSGGMNQRAMIAIALANNPALLIADEPTTALDVTTQARILDLIGELQAETGLAVLFITHDLGVVAEIADDVAVMYLGTVVERGSVTEIFDDPQHPYTKALLESIPTMSSRAGEGRRLSAISGMVPAPGNRPAGCPFHPRCAAMMPGLCDTTVPAVHELGDDRISRCHLHDGTIELPMRSTGSVPAEPGPSAPPPQPSRNSDGALLSVTDLRMHFPVKQGFLGRTVGHVRAVDDVSLEIFPGETVGLVGESGCGKTTLGRCIARAIEPTSGQIHFHDSDDQLTDLATLTTKQLRHYRELVRVIFQDPFSSLNPRKTLLQIISEPLRNTSGRAEGDSTVQDRVAAILRRVGLRPEYMRRYPHAFSGGERQRVNIARALITNPRLVIADEAVSALDVSVRAQILNLLRDLQDEYRLTYLFISHDLSVVELLCDRVAVMYLGKIVESATTWELFERPRHPYTEALLSAVPIPDPHVRDAGRRIQLADDLPDPANAPSGCPFHTRCPHVRAERCGTEFPDLEEKASAHWAACHYSTELSLAGVSDAPTGRAADAADC